MCLCKSLRLYFKKGKKLKNTAEGERPPLFFLFFFFCINRFLAQENQFNSDSILMRWEMVGWGGSGTAFACASSLACFFMLWYWSPQALHKLEGEKKKKSNKKRKKNEQRVQGSFGKRKPGGLRRSIRSVSPLGGGLGTAPVALSHSLCGSGFTSSNSLQIKAGEERNSLSKSGGKEIPCFCE